MTTHRMMRLGGRCANGAERDSGVLVHIVPTDSVKALCGATYGRRSAGWFEADPVDRFRTCPRCAAKLSRAGDGDKRHE